MPDIKDDAPLAHDRQLNDLPADLAHFDPQNTSLLLVYFSREGVGLKYYYRTYKMTKEALWNGIGNGQPLPVLIPWDEPPDGEYPPLPPPAPPRVTKKGVVTIKTLNVRNGASLVNGKVDSLTTGQIVEYWTTQEDGSPLVVDKLNNTIVWAEIETIDGKRYTDGRYVALKYLADVPEPTTRPTRLGTVNTDVLRLRSKASVDGSIVGSVVSGQKVVYFIDTLVKEKDSTIQWGEVYTIDGRSVPGAFLDVEFLK